MYSTQSGVKTLARHAPLIVFGIAASILWLIGSNRFSTASDEGIYLDGARRLAAGEIPYLDFFVLTGPGSFLMQAAVFFIGGVSYQAGRVLVIVEVAVIAASVFWLGVRFGSLGAAGLASVMYLAWPIADSTVLCTNHRWDSSALGILALVLIVGGQSSRWRTVCAGVLVSAAAWATPPAGLLVLLFLGWFALARERRRFLTYFLSGSAGISVVFLCWLSWNGALVPMVRHLLWTGTNYHHANQFPYGGIIGGWAALYKDATALDMAITAFVVMPLFLPAVLPIFAVAVWAYILWRKVETHNASSIGLVLGFIVTSVMTTWPRMDVQHLLYISGPAYALVAAFVERIRRPVGRMLLIAGLAAPSMLFWFHGIMGVANTQVIDTPVGRLRILKEDVDVVRMALNNVSPGEKLFVYPYTPTLYFITAAHNPTPYSFLQPGMMTEEDETKAIKYLRASKPRHVIYYGAEPHEILRIWPSSNPKRLILAKIEKYLADCYQTAEIASRSSTKFRLLVRRPGAECIDTGSPRP